MGYSPWGHKESDVTGRPSLLLSRELLVAASGGHSLAVVYRLLIAAAFLVAEHRP